VKCGAKNQSWFAEYSMQMFEMCVVSVLVKLLKMFACSKVAACVYSLIVERKLGGSEVDCSEDEDR
jgi:hypothetical protein